MVGLSIAIFLAALVTGAVVTYFSEERQFKRRLFELPISASIARTPENEDVRVSGTLAYIEGQPLLTAPISGRACVAWRVIVEVKKNVGKSSYWDKLVDESDATDFALEDGSGRAIVDGRALSLSLDFDASDKSNMFAEGSPRLMDFLRERGIETHGLLLKRALRAREGALERGERATVGGIGVFLNDPKTQAGYRGSAKLLKITALSTGELLATDDRKGSKGQNTGA